MADQDTSNGKIIKMIEMIHEENVRQGGDIKTLLTDVSSVKKHVSLLPCDEHIKIMNNIKKKVEENTYSRMRLGGYIAGISGVLIFIFSYIVPLFI